MATVSVLLFEQTKIWSFVSQPFNYAAVARQMHGAAKFLDV